MKAYRKVKARQASEPLNYEPLSDDEKELKNDYKHENEATQIGILGVEGDKESEGTAEYLLRLARAAGLTASLSHIHDL